MNRRSYLATALTLLLVPACADDPGASDDVGETSEESGEGGGDETGGSGGTTPEWTWGACPVGFAQSCHNLPVPLDWQDSEGAQIELLVSRVAPASGEAKQQLWLVAGGPGESGEIFAASGLYEVLPQLLPGVEIFVLEHRGVGHSARLSCSQEGLETDSGTAISPGELPGCVAELQAEWGSGLAQFNTRNAALDLGYAVEAHARAGVQKIVAGFSYGTLVSQRLLDLRPGIVDGVVLDSVLPASGIDMADYDGFVRTVFRDWADLCQADTTCRAKMGDDPVGRSRALMTRLDEGHCSELGIDRRTLGHIGANLLAHRQFREHLFPLFYRLLRCTPEDMAVVGGYAQKMAEQQGQAQAIPLSSNLLGYNIIASEAYDPAGPNREEAQAACDEAILCPGVSVDMIGAAEHWPRYTADAGLGQWPQTDTPILSMNGTLDPQTPHGRARTVEEHYDAPHQHYVEFPNTPHIVVMNSTTTSGGPVSCGTQLLAQFVGNPQAPLDLSCVEELQRPNFSPNDALTQALFGGADVWENPGGE